MLALAIALLFTFAGIVSVLAITDSALKARTAYARLMAETGAMQAGFGVPTVTQPMAARRPSPRPMAVRRVPLRRASPLLACAAA